MSTDNNTFRRVNWDSEQPQPSDDDDERGAALVGWRGSPGLSDADLELLTLAARAIGAQVEVVEGENWLNLHFADKPPAYNWNPLVHSDDAFELAVQLNIDIYGCDKNRIAEWDKGTPHEVVHGGDKSSAQRRAVTRAAAEIGKAIP